MQVIGHLRDSLVDLRTKHSPLQTLISIFEYFNQNNKLVNPCYFVIYMQTEINESKLVFERHFRLDLSYYTSKQHDNFEENIM